NAFGIAYKPYEGYSRGYHLPSAPAFVDEDEFEQDMSAEFRVVVGTSERRGQPLTTSDIHQIRSNKRAADGDDFHYGDISAEDEEGMSGGNGAEKPENAGVASPFPSDLQLNNQEALKKLKEEYERVGPAPQVCTHSAPLWDYSSKNIGEGHSESSTVADTGIPEHVGGDVRQYPVTEEEEEKEEEGEPKDGHVDFMNNPDKIGTSDVQREKEDEQQIGTEDENEDSRRARVAKEWETIDQLRTAENSVPMEKGVGGTLQPVNIDEDNLMISTKEVLRYFRSQDLTVYATVIIPFEAPESRFGLFRRAPTLKFPNAEELRDEVFLVAQIKYTPDEVMHRRLIQTIYRRMTKEKRACPDVGPHWDTIGFQGIDPCTDLNRSMGMFALFQQVLYLLETQLEFAMVLYRLSLADVTGWPFLCVSIGFTKEAVRVLRRGGCFSECNRRQCVLEVVHELHQAQFHAFLELYRKEPAVHHALHLAKVRARMDSESRVLMKAFRAYLSEEEARSAVGIVAKTGGGAAGHELSDFSGAAKRAD
ncbi:unnamed protein product, partial [Pylaiella littoralis]